jgi:nitrate/TMAO reductase-like tetraheme cytochrome c subunit
MKILFLMLLVGCADKPVTEVSTDSAATPATPAHPEDTGSEGHADLDVDYRSAKWCAECHPTQFSEWEQSMHRYAAHSPVFDHMAAKAFRDTAGATGTFCTGCHSPLGTMDGEPGTTMAADRSDISLEGVTCVVCHQAVSHSQPIGNTSIEIDLNAPMQGPLDDAVMLEHSSVKSDLITSPELCGSCHDVFNFPGLRIEEAYTEYQESPAADMGIRCQDCHMGPEPGVPAERSIGKAAVVDGVELPQRSISSHRFIGPDYSLIDNFPYADPTASAEAQAEMKTQIDTLLKNAVHITDVSTDEGPDQTTLNVVIENRTSGHNVPTGFTSERQLWVEVEVKEDGETVFASGDLDAEGDLRDHLSWSVIAGDAALDTQLVNFQSLNLLRVVDVSLGIPDVYETIFPFDADYIVRRSLAPLEARSLQYTLPPLSPDAEITVRLRYRNLPPYVLRALDLGDLVERLHIFDIDEVVLGRAE